MAQLVLHPAQSKILASSARFITAIAGIRGGKTTIGGIWLLSEIDKLREQNELGDFLIAAPTYKILEQSTLPKFKEFFPKDWGTWMENKGYFKLNWFRPGSDEPCRIYVRSMDEPDSIEGMDIRAGWLDEVGKMKSAAWINAQGRGSVHKARMILTTTPYNTGWFFRDVYQKAKDDKDYEVVIWKSTDNPAFPKDEYERAKRTLPKAIFERRYEGKFTRLEGLVYPEFDEEFHCVEPFEIPKDWLRFGGMDFGHSVPAAVLCIARDPASNTFYVYKEFYRSEALLKTLSEWLHNESLKYVLADTQAAQNISELRLQYGNKEILEANKAVEVGIQRIRSLFGDGRLKIFRDKCPNLVEELLSYHYKAPNEDTQDNDSPVKKHDHAVDALRYGFSRPLQGLYLNKPQRSNTHIKQYHSNWMKVSDSITGY
jgi:PBSX family phage terminase large subunit